MLRSNVLLLVLVTACGGRVDPTDTDASTPHDGGTDASTSHDANVEASTTNETGTASTCTPIGTGLMVGSANCSVSAAWSCDGASFHVTCNCGAPNGPELCYCDHTGGGSYPSNPWCPRCNVTGEELAKFCGYPH